MRILVVASAILLVVAGAAAWIVDAQPDWYLRTRYPLEYEQVIRAYAEERHLDPTRLSSTPRVASTPTSCPMPAPWG